METRSKKRKQLTSPPNPYARSFPRRRVNPNRSSVKDLRTRRVFSPSISDVKGSIEGAEVNEKEARIDERFYTKGQKDDTETEKLESDLVQENQENGEIGEKEPESDLGVSQNGERSELEIASSSENQSVQTTTEDGKILGESKQTDCQKSSVSGKGCVKESLLREGKVDEQAKPKVKLGTLVPCTRAKLYKGPSSFGYRRLLPFLTDMAKDNTSAEVVHPSQKVDKLLEERSPPSQNIIINGTNKEALTYGHASRDSDASVLPTVECSNTGSPRHSLVESTTLKAPESSIVHTGNNSISKEPFHLYAKTATQVPKIVPDRTINSENPPSSVPDTNSIVKSSSLGTLELSSVKESCKFDKGHSKNAGIIEAESCDGEWIQSTPPDSDIFCKPGAGTTKADALASPWNIRDYGKIKCVGEGEKDKNSNSKAKLGVLVPSSRMKLYKTPSSFSYRRLLPYLMDLAKNEPNVLGNQPCQKVEKAVKEEPSSFLPSQDTPEVVPHEGHSDGQSFGASDILNPNSAAPTSLSNIDCSYPKSLEDPIVEFANQDPVVEFVIQPVESASQVQQDMLSEKSNPAHGATCIVQEKKIPLVIPEPSSPRKCSTRNPSLLPEEVVDDFSVEQKSCISAKSFGEISLHEEPLNIEPVTPSERSVSGSSTGILKRYPRGCRGICSCLNCASFRLHSERAFEFSRNQMQDTEEVATFLMKELSALRTLLEKSTASVESHAVVQVPKAKEACMKALRAEGLVKDHLKQMNQELYIHCRTPNAERPRVRFAGDSDLLLTMGENFQAKLNE